MPSISPNPRSLMIRSGSALSKYPHAYRNEVRSLLPEFLGGEDLVVLLIVLEVFEGE